jgi:hypothetical protein
MAMPKVPYADQKVVTVSYIHTDDNYTLMDWLMSE